MANSVSSFDLWKAASKVWGIPVTELMTPVRKRHYVEARAAVAFYMRSQGRSYEQIGRLIQRDQSSVRYLLGRVDQWLNDPDFKARCNATLALAAGGREAT